MKIEYPITFDANDLKKDAGAATPSVVTGPLAFKVTRATKANQETHRFRLASIGGWPETKTAMETQCRDVPIIGRVCVDLPVVYHRTCTKYVYVDVSYPTGMLGDVEDCVKGAALASAVAAIISSGAAAAGTFEAALKGCLAAKGAAWADQIGVSAGSDSECGDWHPI